MPAKTLIDLNSDLGEAFGPWPMGDDATMLSIVTSANIACGGHASDPQTMFRTLSEAGARGVVIGAHPGYDDKIGFGRRVIPMSAEEIGQMVAAQIGALCGVAALSGVTVDYCKPHGALANLAADDAEVARAILNAVRAQREPLAILAISGTELERVAAEADHPVYSEIFADRAYLATGRLVPRVRPDAMIHDADAAADRIMRFLDTGLMPVVDGESIPLKAHSICVHGDSPHAVTMASHIRKRLTEAGVTVAPFLTRQGSA